MLDEKIEGSANDRGSPDRLNLPTSLLRRLLLLLFVIIFFLVRIVPKRRFANSATLSACDSNFVRDDSPSRLVALIVLWLEILVLLRIIIISFVLEPLEILLGHLSTSLPLGPVRSPVVLLGALFIALLLFLRFLFSISRFPFALALAIALGRLSLAGILLLILLGSVIGRLMQRLDRIVTLQ